MARQQRILRWEYLDDSGIPGIAVMERPPGTGSIVTVKRGNRVYYEARAWVTDDLGNKKRRTQLCKTYAQADAVLKDLLRNTKDIRKIKLADFLDRWLAQSKANLRPNTFRQYALMVNRHIKPQMKHITVGGFGSPNARALLLKLEEIGVTASVRREVHKVLHRAFQVAVNDESLTRNPLGSVAKPKVEKKPEHILSREESMRLLSEAAKGEWHLLIRMALTTALREGELFALVASDLKHDEPFPYLVVSATLTEEDNGKPIRTPPKTKDSVRRVELDEVTAQMLRRRASDLGRSDFIFTTPTGEPLRKSNFLRRVFHPMVERAGIPKTRFHSLRKVANTLLLASGDASIRDLQKRLGHKTVAMTVQTYATELPDAQRSVARKAGALFDAKGVA